MSTNTEDLELLKKSLAREKERRRVAEEALETKTREVYRNYQEIEDTLARLRETQGQLIQSEKMASLGTIAAGVAHEINNPLGYIFSNIGSLSDYTKALLKIIQAYEELDSMFKRSSDETTKKFEEIQELKDSEDLQFIRSDIDNLLSESNLGANKVKEIVQGLKSFSRVDEAEASRANINECIETTLKVIANQLKYNCTVIKELSEVPDINCYPGQLNQVFMNLLLNAAQAIEEKGTIRIETRTEGDEITVRISDTGSGIPKSELEKIFNPFFTTKPVGKGTGLGLSISYGIIEKHGGTIDVQSEEKIGTTFVVRIPTKGIAD